MSDPHAVLQQALSNGEDNGAVCTLAEQVAQEGALTESICETLLEASRNWHVEGQMAAQQRLCELIASHAEPQGKNARAALHLLGYHAQSAGEFAVAEEYYGQALAISPDAFTALALAQLQMMRSGFRQGFTGYEARFDAVSEGSGADWRGLPYARWKGETLASKKLYLWAEQGLGDVVMFAGFLCELIAMGPARIALGMYAKLMPVFARSFPEIALEPLDDAGLHALGPTVIASFPQIEAFASMAAVPFSLEPLRAAYAYAKTHGLFDYAAPLGDVLVYRAAQSAPKPAYLKADGARMESIRKQLRGMGAGKCIGISWHTQNARESNRNVPLEQWKQVLAVPGCHFVSLQHGIERAALKAICAAQGFRISTLPELDLLQDAEGLFALIAAMDAVITIDNSNAHIAGAVGVPTTLLLPKGHNFRWPEVEGGGTLWYESVKVLRQKENNDWKPVMAEAAERLRAAKDTARN